VAPENRGNARDRGQRIGPVPGAIVEKSNFGNACRRGRGGKSLAAGTASLWQIFAHSRSGLRAANVDNPNSLCFLLSRGTRISSAKARELQQVSVVKIVPRDFCLSMY
jgi:hypothetical protein